MTALHVGAALCSCISLLCLLIAFSTDYWLADSSQHFGLWKYCDQNSCYPFRVELVSASLHATRTFVFLGVIAGAVSLGGLCAVNYQHSLSKTSMTRIAYIASFTAGLCVMIAMSIITGGAGANVFGWSFGLGWASFPLYLVTGCLTYLLHKGTVTAA